VSHTKLSRTVDRNLLLVSSLTGKAESKGSAASLDHDTHTRHRTRATAHAHDNGAAWWFV
jgi:hypothetical protein